jgi:Zn-dependent peptidase ImmA (M78 family)
MKQKGKSSKNSITPKIDIKKIETINITPFVYKLVLDNDKVEEEQNSSKKMIEYYGYCDKENEEIVIRDDLNKTNFKIVLLHEIIHAMLYKLSNSKHDEQAIELISTGLYELIKNNPHLISFLKDE